MTDLTRFLIDLPSVLCVLLKITVVLGIAWTLHFSLWRCNPRWRVLLWRCAILAVIVVPALHLLGFPRISVAAPPEPTTIISEPTTIISETIVVSLMTEMQSSIPLSATSVESMDSSMTTTTTEAPSSSSVLLSWIRSHVYDILWFVWGLIAVIVAMPYLVAYAKVRKRITSSSAVPEHLQQLLDRVGADLGWTRKVELRYAPELASPYLAGIRRPVIILPQHMIEPEFSAELPGIFAHEIAHLLSHDLLWMIAARWSSVIIWFHLLFFGLRSAHHAACEKVCDAVGANYVGDKESYSSTLARIALDVVENVSPVGGVPMMQSSDIIGRLRTLKRRLYAPPLARKRVVLMLLVGLAVIVGLGGLKLAYAPSEESLAKLASEKSDAEFHPIPSVENLPGRLVFQGKYLHRSRRREYGEYATLWVKQEESGAVVALSDAPFLDSISLAVGDAENRPVYYATSARDQGDSPASEMQLEFEADKVSLVQHRGGEGEDDRMEYTMKREALFDPNTRPDPYTAANILVRRFNLKPGGSKEFTMCDWSVDGLDPFTFPIYNVRVEHKGLSWAQAFPSREGTPPNSFFRPTAVASQLHPCSRPIVHFRP